MTPPSPEPLRADAPAATRVWVWRHPRPEGVSGLCIGAGVDPPVHWRRSKRLARRIQAHARRPRLAHRIITSPLKRCADAGRWLRRWGWEHSQRADLGDKEMESLRSGEALEEQNVVISLSGLTIKGKKADRTLTITLKDFKKEANTVFFGDRPLDNPGYHKFELSGAVGAGVASATAKQMLDVFKVEQRLKYLGFCAFNTASTVPLVPNEPRVPVDFKVDGDFEPAAEMALRGFYGATHYRYNSGGMATTNNLPARTVQINGSDNSNLLWINAYNAPHWVNAHKMMGIPYAAGSTTTDWQSG